VKKKNDIEKKENEIKEKKRIKKKAKRIKVSDIFLSLNKIKGFCSFSQLSISSGSANCFLELQIK
jgi:hypothetical protein